MTFHEYAELEQGTDAWLEQRRGMVTASVVGQLITSRRLGAIDFACPECGTTPHSPCRSKRDRTPIKTLHPERTAYAAEDTAPAILEPSTGDYARGLTAILTAERISGHSDPVRMTDDMWRGVEDEPRARDLYSETWAPVRETGFMVRDDWGFSIGYSPDGVVGKEGLIEAKSRKQKKHLLTILSDEVPAENMAQCQTGLLVTGRKWIDYLSYCGGMPMWRKRIEPDPQWFEAIVAAVALFEKNSDAMVADYLNKTEGLPATERVVEVEMY